jgi:tRNA (guanine-N1)-methyltransferase
MRIDLLTLFPEFFASPLSQSMLKRAQDQGAVTYGVINLRDYAGDRHQVTDDRPFGGGPGMVMKIEPLAAAIRAARPWSWRAAATCCSSAGITKAWTTAFIFILMKSCQ